eukprot:2819946-Prorocentrum_lima.AAC.1
MQALFVRLRRNIPNTFADHRRCSLPSPALGAFLGERRRAGGSLTIYVSSASVSVSSLLSFCPS